MADQIVFPDRGSSGGRPQASPHSGDRVSSNLPPDIGYAVQFPGFNFTTANAAIYSPNGYSLPLFITGYSTSFALSGTDSQSQMVKTFNPRNFQQVSFQIEGQCPNQAYYNRLGEFVRYLQRKAISTSSPGKLIVLGGGTPIRQQSHQGPPRKAQNNKPGIKGFSQGFIAEGYVDEMERGGEFGVFAPSYTFNFIISRMLSGLYQENPVTIRRLASWAEILNNQPSNTFVVDPDAVGNNQGGVNNSESTQTGILVGDAFPWTIVPRP